MSARIQGKSGAPAPPKSAPTAQRGPSPMGPDGMPMDRATIPEGKMSRGSNGKTYRSVGGWMQFVTPAPAGAGEGALATGSDGRRYRNVGGWMQLVQ